MQLAMIGRGHHRSAIDARVLDGDDEAVWQPGPHALTPRSGR